MNTLYYGDNLEVLAEHFPDESVDLIYLDPPFNSKVDYNVIFREHNKDDGATAQILAFEDTWHWTLESEHALDRIMAKNGKLAELLYLIVGTLQKNDLSAYLVSMAERLNELRRVLKPSGSLYLHCDPVASHYLKMVLDILFGAANFRNEIIWKRTSAHSGSKRWGDVHDTILFYGASKQAVWNPVYQKFDESYVNSKYKNADAKGRFQLDNLTAAGIRQGDSGAPWKGVDPTAKGRHWAVSREVMKGLVGEETATSMSTQAKLDLLDSHGYIYWPTKGRGGQPGFPRFRRYLAEGVPVQDVITDIPPVNSQAAERLGYPTQKPVALLERIISVSSNPGDVVLDPFCGCGTAVAAAQKLGRQWRGIDITHLSVALMTARLERDFGLKPGKDFQVEGTPRDVGAARYLFERDPFQFQFWIVGLAGAQPYGATASNKKGKKGGDTGIDGQMFFRTPAGEKLEKVIVSVKGGKNLNPAMVRDLVGTVQRESAAIGVFITIDEPTKGMKDEAAKAGTYKYGAKSYPKIQLLTVQEILEGKRPEIPHGSANMSFERQEVKTLQRQTKKGNAPSLFGDD
ncbi:site-specific DNA-methyltransferase (adenine-specific) [Deinococcus sp. HSC-46F16]|uniref:DNA methyltransferase n=1 Tax=Deinococcus sp. HSC-46F16 TaxID=2910968 RepID=UPI00209E88CC|nr:site-specific DNA-methyltransferase (adenine-specific) [Deinococcus sp. HSC-46F16]